MERRSSHFGSGYSLVNQSLKRKFSFSTNRNRIVEEESSEGSGLGQEFDAMTFGEKIRHKMIHDHRVLLTEFADKVAVKERVAQKIGREHVVPSVAVLDDPSDFDFVEYPREFVLKPSHGSQAGILFHNESARHKSTWKPHDDIWGGYYDFHPSDLPVHIEFMREISNIWLKSKYRPGVEVCYEAIPPKLIIEKYLRPNPVGSMHDFRMYTFHGKVKFFRATSGLEDYTPAFAYDEFGLPLVIKAGHDNYDGHGRHPTLPAEWATMKNMAEILSEGVDFVRVDFYLIGHRIYFSELTNYPLSGTLTFTPDSFAKLVSSYWKYFDCCVAENS